MNTNGLLSFGRAHTIGSSFGATFTNLFTPPIIAPFWDDIDITKNAGGTIYYRQSSDPALVEQVQRAIVLDDPEAASFQPSLIFVATWYRVAPFNVSVPRGLRNTFQAVIASDGALTYVRFSYGDIEWGGFSTLIGVSAGDRINFVTHPASQSSSVLSLDNTTVTYRVGNGIAYKGVYFVTLL